MRFRRDRLFRFLLVVLFMTIVMQIAIKADAKEKENECRKIRTTFYVDDGITKSGTHTRDGVAAMNDYYLGATVLLYSINEDGSRGKLVKIVECEDTGSHKELKSGKRIDLWMPSLEEGWDFVSEYGDYLIAEIYFDCVG